MGHRRKQKAKLGAHNASPDFVCHLGVIFLRRRK